MSFSPKPSTSKAPTMRYLVFLLALVPITAFSQGTDDGPVLLVTKSGFYLVTSDANGVPTTTKINKVVGVGPGGGVVGIPPVIGGPDIPPPVASEITQKVKGWAEQVPDEPGRQALALVYKTVAEQSAAGKIKDADVFPAVKMMTDSVLKALKTEAKWQDFRDNKLTPLITAMQQNGELPNQKAKERLLMEISAGLEAAVSPDSPAMSGALLEKIMNIILLVLQFFAADTAQGV